MESTSFTRTPADRNAGTITLLPAGVGFAAFPLILPSGATPIAIFNNLGKVAQVVKVVVFVASTPDFTGQPQVANGASELLGKAFGDAGVHARSAVGVPVLPLDSPVEVEVVVRVAS